ncbi:NAD(P)/FAD-dependent oxidoreductase [Sulfitobacter sp. JB4-11]|uniref:NAD(P)/FAD-dependent oxidoreductase n=1 Tax=Sulfitobacter rhodophyticola TaxID=3238304 RepID=UPI003D81807F
MARFPITADSAVSYPGPPPAQTDVVVIGGGVIGVCTALYLTEAGQRVTLLEKGRIAGEQSSRNWGWIRQQGRDPAELPIMMQARRDWCDLARRTNTDFGLRQGGTVYLARDDAKLAGYARWQAIAQAHDLDTELLSAAQTAALFPGLTGTFKGALRTASDMHAEPALAVPALAAIAARAGVTIVENCAVRALDIAAGRVAGVVHEAGRIAADSVVLAGGAWSSLFLANHGVHIPQLSVRDTVLATQPLPEVTLGTASNGRVAFRRRADGGYTLAPSGASELFIGPDAFRALPKFLPQLRDSPWAQTYLPMAPKGYPDGWRTPRRWTPDQRTPFEDMRVLNPAPSQRRIKRALRAFAALFPHLPQPQARQAWAGMIDTMPDIVPVVDRCASLPGLIIGTGMSGHGFGIGPGMGRELAALVTGAHLGHDLTRFRASRFTDGSAIRLPPL